MQSSGNQSLSLTTISSHVTSQLMTSYNWPIAANTTGVLFSLSTIETSALITGESTQNGDQEAPVSLSIISGLLKKYYSLFLLLFGTLGNVLCFGVLSRKTFRKSTIGIFLRFLTLADLSALWTGVLYFVIRSTFDTNIRGISELSCKIHFWLSYSCCDLGSWALILVSSARLASILRPMSRFITNRRAYIAILFTIVLALSANLPIFFMFGDVYIPSLDKTKHCAIVHKSYRYFILYVWTWIVLFKFAVIPGTILLGLNIVLILHVYRSKRIIEDMQRGSFNKNNTNRGQAKSQLTGHSDGGRSDGAQSSSCCGCRGKQVPIGHGIHQLGRGLANKISFSRWRRKAVINKDVSSDLNNFRDIRDEDQRTSLMLPDGTRDVIDNNLHINNSRELCNGNAAEACSKLSKIPFHSSNRHSKITFQDQEPTKFNSSRRSLSSNDRLTESETRPFKTCSLHESYADINQLRDPHLWNNSNTSALAQESILFLNHNIRNMYRGNKCKSCSNIPKSIPVKKEGKRPNYDRPRSLSLLKSRNDEVMGSNEFENQAESSCDQFFTGGELELSPTNLNSQCASPATIQDQILYDDFISLTDLQKDLEPIEKTKSVVANKGNKTETSLHYDLEEDSGESSSEEFFSCADETKFSPLLRNKEEKDRIPPKTEKSQPTIMSIQFENHNIPVQSTNIPGDSKTCSISCNKDLLINQHNKSSSDAQTINVIINDLAFLCEDDSQPPERDTQGQCKEPKTNDCLQSGPMLKSKSCNTSPIRHDTIQPTPSVTLAETASSDCLQVATSNNICDINVTRCSSTNDVLSLNEQTPEKSQEVMLVAGDGENNGKDDVNDTGTSQANDKTAGGKFANLCVTRRSSGHKRDKQVSIADLNLSLSSLGKASLNSGNTDISSFTIAPPSAFTSAENLTTTTNAEALKCGSKHRTFSVDQHATCSGRSMTFTKRNRSQQKKKGQKSTTSMFPRSSARPKNLTRTLLVINSVFLICNIPIVIYMTGKTYFFPGGRDDRQRLFELCANLIMYTNNALNFLLYCLTGTRFRHQLRAMFKDAGIAIRGSIRRPPRQANL